MSSEKLITLTWLYVPLIWLSREQHGKLILWKLVQDISLTICFTFSSWIPFSCNLGVNERCYFPVGCRQKTAAPVKLSYQNKKGMQSKEFCTFNISNMVQCPEILQEQLSHLLEKKTASPDTSKLVIFSILSSLCLCDTFSYAFCA